MDQFAREDPKIKRHLDVVHRKELLEHVLKEMDALRALEAREKRGGSGRNVRNNGAGEERRKKGWRLF